MSVGHGSPGLLTRLPTFKDLQRHPAAYRLPFFHLQLGLAIETGTAWTVHSGQVYKTTVSASTVTKLGVIRPIVGVESLIAPRPLTRVERVADVAAGCWYYDDSALVAGGSTDVYVRLPLVGGTSPDPDTTTVVLLLLFTFDGRGEVHPLIGGQKQANAGLNIWTDPTTLASWNGQNVAATGVAITQETSNLYEGSSALRIAPGASGLAAGTNGGANAAPTVGVAGAHYLVDVAYWTSLDLHADLSARVRARLGPVGDSILEDGVGQTSATAGVDLGRTYEQWCRALFVFRCPTDLTNLILGLRLHNSGAGSASGGYVLYDDFHFHRIWRYCYYEPRLAAQSLPELEVGSSSIFFGPLSVGTGSVALLDGDGQVAATVAGMLHNNKAGDVLVGGQLLNGGEVYRAHWEPQFPGLTRTPTTTDAAVTLPLEDARTLTVASPRDFKHRFKGRGILRGTYRKDETPDIDPASEGRPKPLIFGSNDEPTTPVIRINLTGNGYGEYTFLDERVPILDGVDVTLPASFFLRVFPNEELASKNVQGYDITDDVNDFTVSDNNTLITVLRDIRNMRYDRGGLDVGTNASFDFTYAGTPGTADLDIEGPPYKVLADLQASMRAAAGGVTDIVCTYNESTHLPRIQKTGVGNLVLNMQTGPNAHKESYRLLGYNTNADSAALTGGTFADATEPLFTSPESDHVIRIPAGGYTDDAAGSIAGAANQPINSPPAVASWLLQKVLGVPASKVDVALTFAEARLACLSSDFSKLFVYLKDGDGAVFDALAWLGQVMMGHFIVGGDGVWRVKKWSTDTSLAPEFSDLDYLSWRMWDDISNVYDEVRIHGDYNPSQERFLTFASGSGVLDAAIPVKHGVEARPFEVPGYLERSVIDGGLQLVSGYYSRLINLEPRLAAFSVMGRLMGKTPGDKVILSRSRAYDPTGALAPTAFRLVSVRHNYLSGVSTCVAVEDVDFT